MTDNEFQRSDQSPADRRRARLVTDWARLPYWSPEEGVVLAYDLDPKEALQSSVTGYEGPKLRASAEARPLWDHAHRAVEVGSLDARPAPIAFMKWARSVDVEFHSDWWDAVVREDALAKDEAEEAPPAATAPELTTKERDSLLKMVAAMAMAYYGWDRDALRNSATTEIASDLERVGVPLHPTQFENT